MQQRLPRSLASANVLIPRHPGVLSAAGLLAAPIEHEVAIAFPRPLVGLEFTDVRGVLDELDRSCARLMAEEKHRRLAHVSIQYSADVWYIGQSYHLEVPLDARCIRPARQRCIATSWRCTIVSTATPPNSPPRSSTCVRCIVPAAATIWTKAPIARLTQTRASRHVAIRVAGARAPVQAAIYHRAAMPTGLTFAGPAIVEQDDTTTLVEPGWRGTVLDNGNLLLTRG